ncbi:pilus assembly protein PilC [Candidatus Nanosynbacter lyticus]|uniref:Pilus assembly protein PilC n=1 Tax=Candidatus Nanosynbacter lyticus TaxID=2093824 RepID=A0A6S4GPQ8_9BACT|nr:type II secretion system F family protein [Candidatus Nanosynbacter lyticus]AJA06306.1 pilus assembly protein PilC [Candidatus Nanosynbacter lyticus]QCT41256.1 type II secretion system F family protein [TM7 phylum sp. oral taxon 952]
MKKYNYEARDSASNKIVKSVVQAESENAAAKLLTTQGFVPLKIELQDDKTGFFAKLSGRITTKDKVVFTRQLATLIGAGLPLSQSLRTVQEQTTNKRMQEIVQEIISDVEGGKSLSDSFAKHPEAFNKVYVALVAAGETSGTMDESLKRLAAQQEKDAAMMSKIRGAMMYPSIVLAVIILVVGFMLFTVVPQVEGLYRDLNKGLPFITLIMINVANFFIHFWWLALLVMIIGGYFLVQYLKTEQGIRTKDTFKLNVPLFKGMFRKMYMARFSRTGQVLLSTGVPMLDMLRISSDAVNNMIISEGIIRAADKVKGGKALSASLSNEEYFLTMVPQMIKIGEQSGKIDEMMGKTAQVYEDELDEEIRALSTAIEPVLMVFLALVAGTMVAAILFPIYSLVGNINIH